MEVSLRLPFALFCVFAFALPVWADGHNVPEIAMRASMPSADFELGGSVERAARIPAPLPPVSPPRAALSLPLTPANSTHRETNLFGVMIFSDEGWDDGRDAFRLGTAYTQGAATAGVSVTYLDEGTEISRSELFFDFAVNQNITVGLAGILDRDFAEDNAPIPQLGLSAAYSTDSGAFFEGGISEAESSVPLFGLSIGLRF